MELPPWDPGSQQAALRECAGICRGLHTDTPPATGDIVDLENPPPSEEAQLPCAQLPCPAAIELLADINEPQDVEKAIEVRGSFLWLQSISEGSCHLALEITP